MIKDKNIGFIGIGNLGFNLANNILLAGYNLFIYDIDVKKGKKLLKKGATRCDNLKEVVENTSIIINCLPNPKAVEKVVLGKGGLVNFINSKHLIIECSTTDEEQIIKLSKKIQSKGANYLESPLTGGEHRSVTGNIAILTSGKRSSFNRAFNILSVIGYDIIFLGNKFGSASTIKVLTNYLASINLLSISEVFMICKKYRINLKSVYEAIRISSGNSFVHTTEGQVILSGSMDAKFTLDLICKDLKLVNKLKNKFNIPSKLIPEVYKNFKNAETFLGEKAFSTEVVKLLEIKCKEKLRSKGFPNQLKDQEQRKKGQEIKY
tara:strand:+ start:802 stop:1764 length:963 start_codon:yes stop_codon:yes gene_type:complete